MDDKLFDILDDLNIRDTKLLLDEDINLSLDSSTRKRIEKSVKMKTGYYGQNNTNKEKINNILGGIFMKKKIALVLSAAMILSLAGGGYAYAKNPVAYVSVDINPSVELGVNAFDTVVSVEAYNEDGEKVLEGTNLVNTRVEDAVSTVITNAISEGYITQDVTTTSAVVVEITTSTDKEKVATELNESLKEVAEGTLDKNDVDAEVETEKVALLRRDEARKLGITPGKLNLIQKLQQLDSSVTIEDYKDSSVKDIQKKTKELRKNNSQETITEDGESTSTSIDTKADSTTNTVTEEATLSKTSNDLEEAKTVELEKNNNGNDKKDENNNNNSNSNKEENSNTNANEEKKGTTTTNEKQNNSNNVKSKENSNSSKSENSSSSDSKGNSGNSNDSKASNSNNGNSSSGNKGSSKNKN